MSRCLDLLSQSDREGLLLSVGTHKKERRLPPDKVSDLLAVMMHTCTLDELTSALRLRDKGLIAKFLSLQRLPVEFRRLVRWNRARGYLPFSVAAEAARLELTSDVEEVLRDAIENGRTKAEV